MWLIRKWNGFDTFVLQLFEKSPQNWFHSVHFRWATPGKQLHITRLQPHSAIVDVEYALTLCERTVQVSNIKYIL